MQQCVSLKTVVWALLQHNVSPVPGAELLRGVGRGYPFCIGTGTIDQITVWVHQVMVFLGAFMWSQLLSISFAIVYSPMWVPPPRPFKNLTPLLQAGAHAQSAAQLNSKNNYSFSPYDAGVRRVSKRLPMRPRRTCTYFHSRLACDWVPRHRG
jgi:hypothetical protein